MISFTHQSPTVISASPSILISASILVSEWFRRHFFLVIGGGGGVVGGRGVGGGGGGIGRGNHGRGCHGRGEEEGRNEDLEGMKL